MTTLLPFVPVLRPSNVQLPDAASTAHTTDTAFFMHSDVGDEFALPVHEAPVYAVVEGVSEIVSPTAALLYASNKFWVRTVVVASHLLDVLSRGTVDDVDVRAPPPTIEPLP